MNSHVGSLVTPRCSVSTGATVIHREAWRKGLGRLWDWRQWEANEKSMLLWHINLSSNFITGIRCQEKSVVWRWLVGPYWFSWPPCALSWWRKWAKAVSYRKIIKGNENSRTSSVVAAGLRVSNMQCRLPFGLSLAVKPGKFISFPVHWQPVLIPNALSHPLASYTDVKDTLYCLYETHQSFQLPPV